MAAVFPGSVKTYTALSAAEGLPFDVVQSVQDEITAIETYLGSSPSTSFTPTIVSSGGGTPTYSIQAGRYRSTVGEVRVWGRVSLSAFGSLAAGTISIGGLPVPAESSSGVHGGVLFAYWAGLTTAAFNVTGYVAPSASSITVNIISAAVTSIPQMTKADLSASSDFMFFGSYLST